MFKGVADGVRHASNNLLNIQRNRYEGLGPIVGFQQDIQARVDLVIALRKRMLSELKNSKLVG